jgi:hypothetical protein
MTVEQLMSFPGLGGNIGGVFALAEELAKMPVRR